MGPPRRGIFSSIPCVKSRLSDVHGVTRRELTDQFAPRRAPKSPAVITPSIIGTGDPRGAAIRRAGYARRDVVEGVGGQAY